MNLVYFVVVNWFLVLRRLVRLFWVNCNVCSEIVVVFCISLVWLGVDFCVMDCVVRKVVNMRMVK